MGGPSSLRRRSQSSKAVVYIDGVGAKSIAARLLSDLPWWSDEALVITGCDRISRTWVVYYNTRQFAETGNEVNSLIGNGPVLVADDGRSELVGTGRWVEDQVREFEDYFPTTKWLISACRPVRRASAVPRR